MLSYPYSYVSIAVLGASVGEPVGTAILRALGVDSTVLLAIVGPAVFAAGVFQLDLPKVLGVAYTALAGAPATIAGVHLAVDRLEPEQIGSGAAIALVEESWFWLVAWAVLAAVGLGAQFPTTAEFEANLRRELDAAGTASA